MATLKILKIQLLQRSQRFFPVTVTVPSPFRLVLWVVDLGRSTEPRSRPEWVATQINFSGRDLDPVAIDNT